MKSLPGTFHDSSRDTFVYPSGLPNIYNGPTRVVENKFKNVLEIECYLFYFYNFWVGRGQYVTDKSYYQSI